MGTLLKSKFPDASQQVFHTGPSKGNSSVALLTFLHLDQKADVKFSSLGLYHLELTPAMTASFKKKTPLSLAENKLVEALWEKKIKIQRESDPPFLVTYVKIISGNCSLNFCLLTKIGTVVLRVKILLNKLTSFLCRFH